MTPHRHKKKFGVHVCKVTFKHVPQPLRSHVQSFGTLGQILRAEQSTHSARTNFKFQTQHLYKWFPHLRPCRLQGLQCKCTEPNIVRRTPAQFSLSNVVQDSSLISHVCFVNLSVNTLGPRGPLWLNCLTRPATHPTIHTPTHLPTRPSWKWIVTQHPQFRS